MQTNGIPESVERVLAFIGLVLFLPLILVCAIAIVISSPGGVFFRQARIGRNGAPFMMMKLRSMRRGTHGLGFTSGDDDRVTGVGKWLRRLKLDEIPELWNVAKGDMAFVGPRPEVPQYVDLDNPMWSEVLQVLPGLTHPVTLRFRNEEALLESVLGDREAFYRDELLPFKLRGYLEYEKTRTSWRDVRVLISTAIAVVASKRFPPPSIEEIQRELEHVNAGQE